MSEVEKAIVVIYLICNRIVILRQIVIWAISSVGRTSVLQIECRGFEPHMCPRRRNDDTRLPSDAGGVIRMVTFESIKFNKYII